jgi:hypothetical protein
VSLKELKETAQVGGFNIIKANLDAYEYPAFGAALRDADHVLADTHQIHLEMHRFRSDTLSRAWNSLCLGELLFASFFSAGFIPVAAEQRLDLHEAKNVLFVNATWWLASELYMVQEAWKRPRSARVLSRAEPLMQNHVPDAERRLNSPEFVELLALIAADCSYYWINNIDREEEVSEERLHLQGALTLGSRTSERTRPGNAFLFVPANASLERHLIVADMDMSNAAVSVGPKLTRTALEQQPWLVGYLHLEIPTFEEDLSTSEEEEEEELSRSHEEL